MSETEQPKTCFVVTPIGEQNSLVRQKAEGLYKSVIEPVLKRLSFSSVLPQDMFDSGSITSRVVQLILNSDLVIANLTGLNPNVMYELAVRHAIRKPVVILAEHGTRLPFDIAAERTLFYEDSLHGLPRAIEALEKAVSFAMSESPTRNLVYSAISDQQIIQSVGGDQGDVLRLILERLEGLHPPKPSVARWPGDPVSLEQWAKFMIGAYDRIAQIKNVFDLESFSFTLNSLKGRMSEADLAMIQDDLSKIAEATRVVSQRIASTKR